MNLLSDYDRCIDKAYNEGLEERKQKRRDVAPLKLASKIVIPEGYEIPGMTYEEMVDLIEADIAPEALQYRLGKDLVTKEDWANLPTRMRALHKWYKDDSTDGDEILSVKLRDEHYFMREQTWWPGGLPL